MRPRQLTFTASAQPAAISSNTTTLLAHPPAAAAQPSAQPPLLMPASLPMQQQTALAAVPEPVHGLDHSDSPAQANAAAAPASVNLTAAESVPRQTSQAFADTLAAQQDAISQVAGVVEQQQGAWHEALSAPGVALQQAAGGSGQLPSADVPASGQLPLAAVPASEQPPSAALAVSGHVSDSPPSLAWPGAAATAPAPDRQQSLSAAPPARQASGAVPPLSRKVSAVAQLPSRQPSAVASTVTRQGSLSAPAPSRQPSITLRPPSRQGSAAPVTPTSLPDQAVGTSPNQGLEQPLLPTLLAESTRQHSCLNLTQPSDAAPSLPLSSTGAPLSVQAGGQQHEAGQQGQHAEHVVPSVQDILQMWAPVPKPASKGTPRCSTLVLAFKTCDLGMITRLYISCLS